MKHISILVKTVKLFVFLSLPKSAIIMESSYSSRKCVNLHFEPPVLAEKTFVFNPNTQTLSFVDHTIKVIFIKSTLPLSFFYTVYLLV